MASKRRRALSHAGGEVELAGGDRESRRVLERALDVDAREQATLAHVHGFHSYPARLHPDTAARLVEALSRPAASVLDPFCGSGTVLVEARRLGRRAFGVDANPLAVELAWLKTRGLTPDEAEALKAAAREVGEHAEARRTARSGPSVRYGKADRELYDVHVLLELDGLRDGIRRLGSGPRLVELRRLLLLVLSSLLTKVSLRPGDTVSRTQPKRLRAGFTIGLFVRKSDELASRMLDYSRLLAAAAPAANVRLGDARKLVLRSASVDLVLSSPPYPGIYDYLEHHQTRLRWLGFDARKLDQSEIGSRRELGKLSFEQAVARWQREFSACLAEVARVLGARGLCALVVADSVLAGRPLYADQFLARIAPLSALEVVAIGSQQRPHFHAPTARAFQARPRREHIVLMRASERKSTRISRPGLRAKAHGTTESR
jgi:SAM-dependent methyltransferase